MKLNLQKKLQFEPNQAAMTNYPSPMVSSPLSDEEKIALIASHFHDIMQILGLDLNHESLAQTPTRVAKMYVKEIFQGLNLNNFPDLTFIEDDSAEETTNQGLILTRVSFTSFCEHHFVPMIGNAFVGYIPKGKLIGLSKIHRIVRFFAARPQLQERLTSQIADSRSTILETEDVAVYLRAEHFCVLARGVKDESGFFKNKFADDNSLFFFFSDSNFLWLEKNYASLQYDGILLIPPINDLNNPRGIQYRSDKQLGIKAKDYIEGQIAKVLRDLFVLKGDKELSFGERKMLDTARNLLVKELSIARSHSEEKIMEELRHIFTH